MKISVCAPSYRRPKVLTLAYLPFCRVYVDPAEAAAYRAAKKHEPILCTRPRSYHRRHHGHRRMCARRPRQPLPGP